MYFVYYVDMNTSHLQLLAELGLSEKEARVYLAVLELGTASVGEIADHSGIKRTSVYNFIDHLVSLGIITQSLQSSGRVYNAVSPSALVELQAKRLRLVEDRIDELNAITNLSPNKPRIQYFEGRDQMRQLVEKESVYCKKELLAIWNRQSVINQLGGPDIMEKLDVERREKGINIRLIAVKEEKPPFKGGGGDKDDMREIRYAPEGMDFPMGISIYDTGKVGLITSEAERVGILIESKEFETTMRQLFEAFWSISKP